MANKRQDSRLEKKSRTSVFERLGSKSKGNGECNVSRATSGSRRDCKKSRAPHSTIKHLDIKNLESQDDDYLQKKREEICRELDLQSKTEFKHKKTKPGARSSKQSRSSSSSSTSTAASMASASSSESSMSKKSSSKSSEGSRVKKANRLKMKARKIVKSVKSKSKGLKNCSSTLSLASSSASSSSTSSSSSSTTTSTATTASSASSSSPSSLSNSSSTSSERRSKFAPKTTKTAAKMYESRKTDHTRSNSGKISVTDSETSSSYPKSRISRIEDYHSNSRKRRIDVAARNERRTDYRSRSPPIQPSDNRSALGIGKTDRQWNRSPIRSYRVRDEDRFGRRSLSRNGGRRSGGSCSASTNYAPRSVSRTSKDDEEWQRKLSVIERNLAINRMQEKLRNDTNLTREEREMLLEKQRKAALARAQQRQKEREKLAKFQKLSEKNIQFNRMLRKGEFRRRSLDRSDISSSKGEQSMPVSNETLQRSSDRDRIKTHNETDRKRDRNVREREDVEIKDLNRERDYAKERSRDREQVGNQAKRECSDERRTSKFSRRNWSDRNFSEEDEDEDDDDDNDNDDVNDNGGVYAYRRTAMSTNRPQSSGEKEEEERYDNDQNVVGGGGGSFCEAETVELGHESDSSRISGAHNRKRVAEGTGTCISDRSTTAKHRIDFEDGALPQSSALSIDNEDDFDEKSDEWSETDNLRIEEEWDKFEQLDSNKNGSDEILRADSAPETSKEQNTADRNHSEMFRVDELDTRNDDNLSEISDEIDEILNRDEQHQNNQQQQQQEDEQPQPNRNKKVTSAQNSCSQNDTVEDVEISMDFEHISDSEFGEDRKTTTDLSMDWSSLSKNTPSSEKSKNLKLPPLSSSVKQKWTFEEIIRKTGVSGRLLNVKSKDTVDSGVDPQLERQLDEQNGSLAATEALKCYKQELRSWLLCDSKNPVPQLAISSKRDLSIRRFLFDSSVVMFDRQQCILIDADKFHSMALCNFQKHVDSKPLF